MKVEAEVALEVSTKSLARALANDPEAFARLWQDFAIICRDDRVDLEPFGEAMAPFSGGIRKHPFNAILDFMRYYERKEEGKGGK